jgi:preprotein translocase subunit SecA
VNTEAAEVALPVLVCAERDLKEIHRQAALITAGGTANAVGSQASTQSKSEEFKGVGRNDPCPCGSGKKFKKCHGK